MRHIYFFLFALFTLSPLAADIPENSQEGDLRILELLPNMFCPLGVNPNIPADFIALSPSGDVDLYDWVYWGPKDVLEAYFKDPASLKTPILKVKLSANVAQTGPDSFTENSKESLELLKKEDPDFTNNKTRWGSYPVMYAKVKIAGRPVLMAWVGLNDPSGWTLAFNLIYPSNNPSEQDLQLWQNFLDGTTQLNEREYFKACGQDLQEGYTIVNVGGAKLKMLAEKRQSDGTIQVVVIPKDSNSEFHYIDMEECLMGAKWKYGEPMVKVYGEIVFKSENVENIIDYVTSIFFKTVPEFSFKKESDKNLLIFQKIKPDSST